MIFAGINQTDMEDVVNDWIVEYELNGDQDRWDDEEWGFFGELPIHEGNENMFNDVEETAVETIVPCSSQHFEFFLDYVSNNASILFNSKGINVNPKEWNALVKSQENCSISICECSPNS